MSEFGTCMLHNSRDSHVTDDDVIFINICFVYIFKKVPKFGIL